MDRMTEKRFYGYWTVVYFGKEYYMCKVRK